MSEQVPCPGCGEAMPSGCISCDGCLVTMEAAEPDADAALGMLMNIWRWRAARDARVREARKEVRS